MALSVGASESWATDKVSEVGLTSGREAMEPVELLMLVEDAVEDPVELFEAAALPVREAGPRCLRHQFKCRNTASVLSLFQNLS